MSAPLNHAAELHKLNMQQFAADKTPGQLAYEADVETQPLYHTDSPRTPWALLSPVVQWSWHRNPTPRWSPGDYTTRDRLREEIANTGDC